MFWSAAALFADLRVLFERRQKHKFFQQSACVEDAKKFALKFFRKESAESRV